MAKTRVEIQFFSQRHEVGLVVFHNLKTLQHVTHRAGKPRERKYNYRLDLATSTAFIILSRAGRDDFVPDWFSSAKSSYSVDFILLAKISKRQDLGIKPF